MAANEIYSPLCDDGQLYDPLPLPDLLLSTGCSEGRPN